VSVLLLQNWSWNSSRRAAMWEHRASRLSAYRSEDAGRPSDGVDALSTAVSASTRRVSFIAHALGYRQALC
jgi:hypothetical protein